MAELAIGSRVNVRDKRDNALAVYNGKLVRYEGEGAERVAIIDDAGLVFAVGVACVEATDAALRALEAFNVDICAQAGAGRPDAPYAAIARYSDLMRASRQRLRDLLLAAEEESAMSCGNGAAFIAGMSGMESRL